MNGELRKSWEVHCVRCEHPALGLGYGGSTDAAARELREQYGWRLRGGKWACRECAEILRTERLSARALQPAEKDSTDEA